MVGGHATVGWLSNNVFWTFQAIWENFEKSRWTVTRKWLGSRDRRPTVKQRFLDVSSDLGKFWKKSLNGHATVVEVTRPSADCQTTFFGRFKQLEKNLKKVAERSRDSGRRSRDRRLTVKRRFWTFQAIRKKFEKSRWTVTRQWSEVTRPSADCQTTFFGRFKRFGKILKKVAERFTRQWLGSRDRRPKNFSNLKQRFLDVSSDLGKFEKKSLNGHATVVGGHATVGRLSNNVFWTFQAIRENFWKKSLNGHATVVGGHATVGRLSNNVFWTFLAICENFEKSRWTVTRQWSGVTRLSADCQTTIFRRFKQLEFFFEKSR